MGLIGKLRKLNKYCFSEWYNNYLLEYAVNISMHMNLMLFLANKEEIEKTINANKILDVDGGSLYVNSENKTFAWFGCVDYATGLLQLFEQGVFYPEDISDSLNKGIFPIELKEMIEAPKMRICPFNSLTKVEFIDKTTVDENRTYTVESNAGSALMGAIAGSMFSKTIFNEFATAGAIIGANGARKIQENVQKTVNTAFDVILYFNDINYLSETIRFYNEDELREFMAVLEFIMNNKDGSDGSIKEIIFDKNKLETQALHIADSNGYVNKWLYIILALFLGYLGIHHFYAKQNTKGFLYLIFCWTCIPFILALVDIIKVLTKPANEYGEVSVN